MSSLENNLICLSEKKGKEKEEAIAVLVLAHSASSLVAITHTQTDKHAQTHGNDLRQGTTKTIREMRGAVLSAHCYGVECQGGRKTGGKDKTRWHSRTTPFKFIIRNKL